MMYDKLVLEKKIMNYFDLVPRSLDTESSDFDLTKSIESGYFNLIENDYRIHIKHIDVTDKDVAYVEHKVIDSEKIKFIPKGMKLTETKKICLEICNVVYEYQLHKQEGKRYYYMLINVINDNNKKAFMKDGTVEIVSLTKRRKMTVEEIEKFYQDRR